jgi:hypothetical protein
MTSATSTGSPQRSSSSPTSTATPFADLLTAS